MIDRLVSTYRYPFPQVPIPNDNQIKLVYDTDVTLNPSDVIETEGSIALLHLKHEENGIAVLSQLKGVPGGMRSYPGAKVLLRM